jgi:hypothetical protein
VIEENLESKEGTVSEVSRGQGVSVVKEVFVVRSN